MVAWAQFRMDASRHVSRGAGQSAIAAAAYRAGERLYDARTQEVHDYTRRFGVLTNGIAMPEQAFASPGFVGDDWTRERLWNEAEAAEKRRDARTARKIELALPAEMTAEQRVGFTGQSIEFRTGEPSVLDKLELPFDVGVQADEVQSGLCQRRCIGQRGLLRRQRPAVFAASAQDAVKPAGGEIGRAHV